MGASKSNLKIRWHKTRETAFSDIGADSAVVYVAKVKGYYIEVYPVKLFDKNAKGWEYRIFNEEKVDYDSIFNSLSDQDSARTPEEAMRWAEITLRDFLKKEREG